MIWLIYIFLILWACIGSPLFLKHVDEVKTKTWSKTQTALCIIASGPLVWLAAIGVGIAIGIGDTADYIWKAAANKPKPTKTVISNKEETL